MGDADRKTPHIEVTIASPPDAVWHALRDKDTIRQWHGWHASELDSEIDLIYFTGMTEDPAGRVLTLKNGDRFTLTPDGGGTRLTMTRAPLGANPEWDAYYDDITEGWISFLHQLKFALERQPGVARRTLFFSHHGKDSGSIIERLGLGGPAQQPPGGAYATTLWARRCRARCGSAPTTSSASPSTPGPRWPAGRRRRALGRLRRHLHGHPDHLPA